MAEVAEGPFDPGRKAIRGVRARLAGDPLSQMGAERRVRSDSGGKCCGNSVLGGLENYQIHQKDGGD